MRLKGVAFAASCLASLAIAQPIVNGTNSSTAQPALPDPSITTIAPPTDTPVTPLPSTQTQSPSPPPPPSSSAPPVTQPPPTPHPSTNPPSPPTNAPTAPTSPPSSTTSQPIPPTNTPSSGSTVVPSEEPSPAPSSTNSVVAPKTTPSSTVQVGTTGSSASDSSSSDVQTGGNIGGGGSPVLAVDLGTPAPSTSQEKPPRDGIPSPTGSSPTATQAVDTVSNGNEQPSSSASLMTTLGSIIAAVVVCAVVAAVLVQRHRRSRATEDHDDIGFVETGDGKQFSRLTSQSGFVPKSTSKSQATSLSMGPSLHEPSSQSNASHLPDSPNELDDPYQAVLTTNEALGAFGSFMASLQTKSPLASSRSAWHAAAEEYGEVGSYGSHSSNSSGVGYSSSLGSSAGSRSSLHKFEL